MKQLKSITFVALIIMGWTLLMSVNAQENKESPKLSDEQKRFDLNGDGKLSDAEDELRLRVTGLEAFTGDKFSREDIEKIQRNSPPDGGFGGPPGGMPPFGGGRGGRGGPRPPEKLVHQFDEDKDGKLTGAERDAALQMRGGSGKSSLISEENLRDGVQSDVQASLASTPEGSPSLYDAHTVRTIHLRFHHDNWDEQMNAFYRTDIEVPAELIVDGKVYSDIGAHFRGTSSFFTVRSEKKSFNIAVDYGKDGQRLYGYKTLNLLNGHVDASFLREVLYNQISRDFIPAMKTNLVKLVINGENWGVYINLQQYNKDFLAEWFGTRGGVRWKVGPGRGGALNYTGDDPTTYQETYQLKTNNVEDPWTDLIALCRMLDETTPDAELSKNLPALLNIDQVLWQLAVSNVFMDDDGYIHKGGDYAIYQDVKGRFQLVPHDNNESFRFGREGRGGPGGGGPGGWSWGDLENGMVSPVAHEDNAARPLIKRLLSNPEWRARYLAHVRTVVDEWLSWEVLEPIIKEYQALIDTEVQQDEKKLYGYEEFATGVPADLERFVNERREHLRNHPEINKPVPKIIAVEIGDEAPPIANQPVSIKATLDKSVAVDSVFLYYSNDRHAVFNQVMMTSKTDSFVGQIPAFPASTTVYYYVEANAVKTHGTTAFLPARTEQVPSHYSVGVPVAKESPVVINELMAFNTKSLTDPQGQYEDWLELHNLTNGAVNLSGMYLTDKMDNLKKWEFPENATIPAHGYLLVWLDEDGKAKEGLHANFKLSRNGETVMLVDADKRGNQVLDTVTFEKQEKDVALGRWPNGSGTLKQIQTTPGEENAVK
ncbi:CotH kinase family protein [Candidatus Poribacteria bacterium]|nr:CotH kinase family protein [Candidatus Poribacteria bacterium]